jgi:predicted dithiol-disulfide oxidoreductase (DUF899 family)
LCDDLKGTSVARLRTRICPNQFKLITHDEWIKARQELVAAGDELSRPPEQLGQQPKKLPWEKVRKTYTFEGPDGQETLSDLFAGKPQLVIYYFVLGPDWQAVPKSRSDGVGGSKEIDLNWKGRDTTFVAVSRTRYETLTAYKRRLGWTFKWVSSYGSDFNLDFHVSFTPEHISGVTLPEQQVAKPWGPETVGVSVFSKDDNGDVYHRYSCYSRGSEALTATWALH